nr:helix-turn-helix domain-containing protein [Roseomonas aerilata]
MDQSSEKISLGPLRGPQLRAARALLGWSAQDLADRSGVGIATIRRAEGESGVLRFRLPILAALRNALESAGVVLIPENGGGAGVRMREASGAAARATKEA